MKEMKDFSSYIGAVDAFIGKKTNSYFPKDIRSTNIFFREIFHVIKQFLQEADSNKLFIKVPVHEFGIKKKDIENNFTRLQGVISDALCYATAAKQKEIVRCPDLDISAIGKIVYCHNDYSAKYNYPQFFEIASSVLDGIDARPRLILDGKNTFRTRDAINIYNSNKVCIFKMKAKPTSSDKRTMRHIESMYQRLKKYFDNAFETQYNSALIVGFTDSAKRYERTYSNIYFESPVSFTKRFSEEEHMDNDVVCFVGDRKYADVWDDIQRGIGQGRIKKVIYIGTRLDDLKDVEGNRKYEFSLREIYHYFMNDQFPQVRIEHLSFPWIEERLIELNTIIDKIPSINDGQRKLLVSHIFWNYVGIDIVPPDEDQQNRLSDFIYENLSISNEEEDQILNWFSKSHFDNISPKGDFCKKIPANKNVHIVSPFSYKQKYKKFINGKNDENNVVVIDVQCDSYKYQETLKDLFMHLPCGEIVLLSYTNVSRIVSFFDKEMEEYNGNYRVQVLEDLIMKEEKSYVETETKESDLSDYFVLDLLNEYFDERSTAILSHTQYCATFEDGTSSVLSGNVLVGKDQVPVSEITDFYKEDDFPVDITYYVQPENFGQVFEIIKNYPKGRDVSYYSSLWKQKLYEYCEKEYDFDKKRMHKEQFPFLPKQMMSKYIDKDSQVDFPRSFSKLVRRMLALSIVDNTTAQYMMSACKARRESTSIGGKLKDALFQYQVCGEKNEFLVNFDQNARNRGETISSEILLEKCLKTNVLVKLCKIE